MAPRNQSDVGLDAAADNDAKLAPHHWHPALALVLLLFAGCAVAAIHDARWVDRPFAESVTEVDRVRTDIDPNTAQWFEFAQLPGIGETVAKRIVSHRDRLQAARDDARSVFERPSDLIQVRGIGDKTVRRIRPFLRFPNID